MLASAHDDVAIGVAKRVIWQWILASEVQRETKELGGAGANPTDEGVTLQAGMRLGECDEVELAS